MRPLRPSAKVVLLSLLIMLGLSACARLPLVAKQYDGVSLHNNYQFSTQTFADGSAMMSLSLDGKTMAQAVYLPLEVTGDGHPRYVRKLTYVSAELEPWLSGLTDEQPAELPLW